MILALSALFGRQFWRLPLLQAPGAPLGIAEPIVGVPGGVTLTILSLPASWGDAAVPGDSGGVAGHLEYSISPADVWVSVPASLDSYTLDLPSNYFGLTATIFLRAVNQADIVSAQTILSVSVPDLPPNLSGPSILLEGGGGYLVLETGGRILLELPPSTTTAKLLLEDGNHLLLEDGSYILLEE